MTLRPHHHRSLRLAADALAQDASAGRGGGWRHHTQLGGARTLDELRDSGLVEPKLSFRSNDPRTWVYRITPQGAALVHGEMTR